MADESGACANASCAQSAYGIRMSGRASEGIRACACGARPAMGGASRGASCGREVRSADGVFKTRLTEPM
ncbi:hypothetical protein B5F40_15355 [Gordonibacter sp. An230]|nr:hypothetical protein B5F40_15355 [Gordonibacter sp. An230]